MLWLALAAVFFVAFYMRERHLRRLLRESIELYWSNKDLQEMQSAWSNGFRREDDEPEEEFLIRWRKHKVAVIEYVTSKGNQ